MKDIPMYSIVWLKQHVRLKGIKGEQVKYMWMYLPVVYYCKGITGTTHIVFNTQDVNKAKEMRIVFNSTITVREVFEVCPLGNLN